MTIQFVNNSARQIYNRVLGNTKAAGKEDVQTLFSLAADEDGDMTLSQTEARNVEEELNRCDHGLFAALGIKSYDKEEIGKTLDEYRAREKCLFGNLIATNKAAAVIDLTKAFIQNYPDSKFIPKAYCNLGSLYYYMLGDYDNAIAAYEEFISLYPTSAQAFCAMVALGSLYDATDKENLSYFIAQTWLTNTPRNSYKSDGPPFRDFDFDRSNMLFSIADYLRGQRKINEATEILNELIFTSQGYYSRLAKGSLSDLNGICSEEQSEYLNYRIHQMSEKAQYFLHEKHDFIGAKKIYQDLLELAGMAGNKHFICEANAAFTDMQLQEKKLSSDDALEAVNKFAQMGMVPSMLEYYNPLITSFTELDTIDGIPAEIYLLGILLKSCRDVEEVRLASLSKNEAIDSETKTLINNYVLIYKNKNGWNIFDPQNHLDFCFQISNPESLEELRLRLEEQTGYTITSAVWKTPDHLFANSLGEFRNGARLSPYDLVITLEEEKLSDYARKMVQFLRTQINGTEKKRNWLLSFTRAYSFLPKYHFDQLKTVNFDYISWYSNEGEYVPPDKAINLKSSTFSTAVHELTHHWDMTLMRGQDGNDLTSGDPSLIYYKISWDAWSDVSCGRMGQPCGGWIRKPSAEKADFAYDYGMSDGFEDLATSAESYIEGMDNLQRIEVRMQMEKGNFELAAKYLFNKYVRSFDPEDGLCFEYNINNDSPPLTLAEVKAKIESRLASHPNSIPQSTLTAIDEIEREYINLRAGSN